MSRSKRTPQAVSNKPKAANPFVRGCALLILSLAVAAALTMGLRLGLEALLNKLFGVWNLRPDNVARAPVWAQWLYTWQGGLVTLVVGAALLTACLPLRRLWGLAREKRSIRPCGFGTLLGVGTALLVAALSLLPDSSRLAWPLSRPALSGALPMLLLINMIGVLAEEAFTKRVLLDGLKDLWNPQWAVALSCAVFFVMRSGWSGGLVYGLNVILTGVACAFMYAHYGLWAGVGFRWGLETAICLLGFDGGNAAMYRVYGVSELLLTGGDRGPLYGLWLTLALLSALLWGMRKARPR